ncbi:DoxX family protein [Hymenobacter chitinivorans]|uniref:Putative membrane protein n=1 Tax=Hymenobacter chitinivorans DSM 11115 TaxID=1121954 RepID=A0A2M9ARQ6_9BACT|nr:MauE/DoxX family redox-associated membrane protein [Hymenobacter chitinivorans]PJJ48370.1 putative membrane protein [Hymenobacter chitinivorans DSM 11115]
MPRIRTLSRYILAVLFIGAGVLHFLKPEPYVRIMPPYLPWPSGLVLVSGIAEVLLGILLLPRATRRGAAWGLILLLIAVFPANVYMAQTSGAGLGVAPWLAWARLPLQAVLIWWVWQHAKAEK